MVPSRKRCGRWAAVVVGSWLLSCGGSQLRSQAGDAGAQAPADTLLGDGAPKGPTDAQASEGIDAAAGRGPRPVPAPTVLPAQARVVAIGDLHGDVGATRDVLMLAGVLGDDDHWSGGGTVVVQVGDQLDRGDDEQAILDLLERLADEAHAAGGAVHVLLGNHETMNVSFDFRYVTEGGWLDFADTPYDAGDPEISAYPSHQRGRVAAFRPGGEYAKLLSRHNLIMVIGDTAFVHGGLLPEHVTYGVGEINKDVQAWMRGQAAEPDIVHSSDSPVWTRIYSDTDVLADCATLEKTLYSLGLQRMVVAHTVQDSINAACGEQVWRIDVGMSRYYGGRSAALEITAQGVRVLD